MDFPQEGVKGLTGRFAAFYAGLTVLAIFLIFRLGFLQVLRGDFFWIVSSEHTIKEIRTPAIRGLILDRHRIPLASNRPSFDLAVIPQYVRDRKRVQASLQQIASIAPDLFEGRWAKAEELPPYFPLTIYRDLPYELAARLRTLKVTSAGPPDPYDLRGVEVIARPLRSYPSGIVGSATLGHMGEVAEKELARFQEEEPGRFYPGDLVGSSGLEKVWEKVLKGSDGYQQRLVDAVGREVSNEDVTHLLRDETPVEGSDLVLTIDLELQRLAEQLFRGKSGALVAMDPTSGEIYALVSSPNFDPSRLAVNVTPAYWQSLLDDPRKLFLHRAIQAYPPGSTFKIVTALAALEEKVYAPGEKIDCPGGLSFGRRFFRCWQEGGHGSVDLHRALAESCDTFFYHMGVRLGVDRLAEYAKRLGLGRSTGLKIEDEKSGFVPTSDWKKKVFNEEWLPSENLSVSVGQGALLLTPLQNAVLLAEIVNGGRVVVPTLVKEILFHEGAERQHREEKVTGGGAEKRVEISLENLAKVKQALIDAVNAPGGTAYGSRSRIIKIGGKTGTAQVISEQARERLGDVERFRDHAWFVSFAPVDEPKLIVSVLVEHGGFGASAAAPIAKAVIEKFASLYLAETLAGTGG